MTLNVPQLYEGNPALISWSAAGTGYYRLERRLNQSFAQAQQPASWSERDALGYTWGQRDKSALSWTQLDAMPADPVIYEGDALSFTDNTPLNITTVQYRVSAGAQTALSPVLTVHRRPLPDISGQDGAIEPKYRGFSVAFTVHDSFPGAVLEFWILLDGNVIAHEGKLQSPVRGSASVSDAQVSALTEGSAHTLCIRVSDDAGVTAQRLYTFTKLEDLRKNSVYYLLRDGRPVMKLDTAAPFEDYAAVGRHRYQIRAVDRYGGYADSNEIELEILPDKAYLAPASAPEDLTPLSYRLGSAPALTADWTAGYQSCAFEGRTYAAVEDTGTRAQAWILSFSAQSRAEFEAVRTLAQSGKPLIYRDEFLNCALVLVERMPAQFFTPYTDYTLHMTQTGVPGGIDYD